MPEPTATPTPPTAHRGRLLVVAAASTVLTAGLVAGLAVALWPRADQAAPGSARDAAAPSPTHALSVAVAAGEHVRLDGPGGPIHVWRPAGYHADGAATVVYVHGFYTTIDQAWEGYRLPEQFALSGINALFICPEAPAGARPSVMYPDLGALVRLVEERTGMLRGAGPLVAIGHSGAFRTLRAWLDEPSLDQLVMYDAMYGELDEFGEWFTRSPAHRLIVVGDDTVRWTEDMIRDLGATMAKQPGGEAPVVVDRFPDGYGDGSAAPGAWPDDALHGRLVYVRSQYGHMPLVTGGNALPLTLRLLPVEILPDAPWDQPLGDLPPPPAPDAGTRRGGRH